MKLIHKVSPFPLPTNSAALRDEMSTLVEFYVRWHVQDQLEGKVCFVDTEVTYPLIAEQTEI